MAESMNATILRLAGRSGRSPGGVAVPEHGERLSRALGDLESAQRTGDDDLIGYAEHRLDRVVQDARQGRYDREHPRDPETGEFIPAPSFDGGVRGRRGVAPSPGMQEETSTQLFRRAMLQSQYEREAARD